MHFLKTDCIHSSVKTVLDPAFSFFKDWLNNLRRKKVIISHYFENKSYFNNLIFRQQPMMTWTCWSICWRAPFWKVLQHCMIQWVCLQPRLHIIPRSFLGTLTSLQQVTFQIHLCWLIQLKNWFICLNMLISWFLFHSPGLLLETIAGFVNFFFSW